MTIAEELAQGNYSSDITSLSTKALYQLAAGLADSDSEQKQALINRIEQQTEIKGEKLTEAEIKKIREEIQSEFRQKQQELNLDFQQKISMANYKIEVVESENNQLKTKLKKSSQFEQLYKDTYQEKKLFEQELKGKTQEARKPKKTGKSW